MVEGRSTPRQERSQAAREAIIAAINPVVCAVGVDEASTSLIAAEAGVSVGTVYRYFPNKHVLFDEYIDRYRSFLKEQAELYLLTGPDLTDIMDVTRVMVMQTAVCLAKYPAYSHFRLWQRPDSGEMIAASVREQGTEIIQFLLVNHPLIDTEGPALDRITNMVIETALTLLGLAPAEEPARSAYVEDVVLVVTSFLKAKTGEDLSA